MLSRYTMYRRRPHGAGPLPDGIRKDCRYSTSHFLRPSKEMVETYLADPTDVNWEKFRAAYVRLLAERYEKDTTPFDELANLASRADVYLGCSCPTKKNPTYGRCHTYVALEFMRAKYRSLLIVVPADPTRESGRDRV